MKNYFTGINLIPDNESERLQALKRYDILNTPPEDAFDNIAKVACQIFDCPIALVSLVDEKYVFFKANVGMHGVQQTKRGLSLCSLAILSEEVTVFKDAIKEPCLLSNPLVTGDFGLKFYAGAPLKTSDGFNIGTLCIIDKKEREFSDKDKALLKNLASIVMDEMELRISSINAISTKQKFLDILINKNEQLLIKIGDLDNFVYAASHDLKAPVSNIEGLITTLKDMIIEDDGIENMQMVINMMLGSIEKFKMVATGLIDLNKSQNSIENDFSDTSFTEVMADIVILIQELIRKSNTTINTNFSLAPIIRFSKINLISIIQNMIINAIKYKRVDVDPVIDIDTQLQYGFILLQIRDNGSGIKQENIPKMFTKFQRLQNNVEGSGLGLYLVKRIIDTAGGRIEVESEVGTGSVFKIFLPA